MGLYDNFVTARGQILMMNPLPGANHAYALIKQDGKMKQGYTPEMSSTFLGGSIANRYGSSSNYVRSHMGKNTSGCTHCGKQNHTTEKCFQIVGFPPNHPGNPANRGKKKFNETVVQLVKKLGEFYVAPPKRFTDTGQYHNNSSNSLQNQQ